MGVNAKSKRKIEVCGRTFYWYVAPDDEYSFDAVLHVYSEDKRFHVTYALGDSVSERVLDVRGPEFNSKPSDLDTRWRLVVCPRWTKDSIVSPSSVRRLVEWCLSDKTDLTLMDREGNVYLVTHLDTT